MSELHVPDEARNAAYGAYSDVPSSWSVTEAVDAAIAAAAPAIVAAELRRLADGFDMRTAGQAWLNVDPLRARADELDGGAS